MIKYILLGITQGLTEFLPVSSSGHLVIVEKLLGMKFDDVALQLVLHLGTILAVVIFLRREILALLKDRRGIILVLVTTAITGVIGIAGKKFFAGLFERADLLAPQMAFTGIVLLSTGWVKAGDRVKLGFGDAVLVGLAQALAIVPAISRSGMTIAALLFRKVSRQQCFTFAFLISVPAVLGASLIECKDIGCAVGTGPSALAAGFVASLLSGLAALWLLRKIVISDKFHCFGYYCLALAGVLYIWLK